MRSFDSLRTSVRVALLAALVVALPACDSSDPTPPTTDSIFFGVNYTRLFAPATAAEVQAVRDLWSARNPSSSAAEIVGEQVIDGARVFVVRHTVTAGGSADVTHYAAVRIPLGLVGQAPLLVVHHGGDDGFNVGEIAGAETTANTSLPAMVDAFPALFAQTVQVLPVYRSEELRTTGYASLGGPYTAGGSASPWDYDVDDAMATVEAVVEAFPLSVSTTERAALGFSRGGNTAALHAIRDPQMDALVDYYGPTDFYNEAVQLLATGALSGSPSALGLPGVRYLRENVLLPLQGPGGVYDANADYARARLEIARRSASLFTTDLPDTQVHHHYRDGVVPFTFSDAFETAADARGAGGSFELFPYGQPPASSADLSGTFHAPEGIPESLSRVQTFLLDRLNLSPTVAGGALAGAL